MSEQTGSNSWRWRLPTGLAISALSPIAAVSAIHSVSAYTYWWLAALVGWGLLLSSIRPTRKRRPEASRLLGIAIAVCAVLTIYWCAEMAKDIASHQAPEAVGGCWAEKRGSLISVACDNPSAKYRTFKNTPAMHACPDFYIKSESGRYLCLESVG